MALVNRHFNEVFSRKLYKVMRFTSSNRQLLSTQAACDHIIRSPYIQCVKVLVVILEPYTGQATEQMVSEEKRICSFIMRVMSRATQLESFA